MAQSLWCLNNHNIKQKTWFIILWRENVERKCFTRKPSFHWDRSRLKCPYEFKQKLSVKILCLSIAQILIFQCSLMDWHTTGVAENCDGIAFDKVTERECSSLISLVDSQWLRPNAPTRRPTQTSFIARDATYKKENKTCYDIKAMWLKYQVKCFWFKQFYMNFYLLKVSLRIIFWTFFVWGFVFFLRINSGREAAKVSFYVFK